MLSQREIDLIIETMLPYKPVRIGIFGSYARGEQTPESDVDILYEFEEVIRLFDLVKLQASLQRKLGKKVDLVSEKYIHPKLRERILNEVNIVYGQPRERPVPARAYS